MIDRVNAHADMIRAWKEYERQEELKRKELERKEKIENRNFILGAVIMTIAIIIGGFVEGLL